jgi:ABC-2 type transport system permease protein
MPPYQTYVLYEVYIVPGLVGMMLLFYAMQSSLSMVYDREMGSMRTLLVAPLPRWFLLGARLLANTLAAIPPVYVFLFAARLWEVRPPWPGYVAIFPALLLAGVMLGAFGLLLSSFVRQLENFAGVMNFAVLPMFFASTDRPLPALAAFGREPLARLGRSLQPVHSCGRDDPLCALSAARTGRACHDSCERTRFLRLGRAGL